MRKLSILLLTLLGLGLGSAWACPGDKAKDDGKQSTPKKPTTSLHAG